ncbi:MAG: hypothetical protein IT320_26260 [Anaerolineae bacterium]|nr:hypothetical protein [Anaerolineae bacterium]
MLLKSALSIPYITHPAWENHEADFYNVVRFMVSEGRFPTRADYPDANADVLQVTQPPLYFIVALPVLNALDSTQPVPAPPQPLQMCIAWEDFNAIPMSASDLVAYPSTAPSPAMVRVVLRLLNVTLTLAAVVLTALTVLKLVPRHYVAALLAAGLLAFEPTLFGYMAEINNDPLLAFLAALNMYFCASLITSPKLTRRDILGIPITLLLAILTRLNGWSIVAVDVVMLFIFLHRLSGGLVTPRRRKMLLLLIGAVSLSIIGIIVINLILYGSLFGRYQLVETNLATTLLHNFTIERAVNITIATVRDLASSYSGPLNTLRPSTKLVAAYVVFTIIVIGVATLGAVRLWRRNRAAVWLPILFVASATALVLARNFNSIELTTEYSTTLIYTPVRYFITGLPAAAVFITVGLSEIRFGEWLAAGLGAGYLALTLLGILNLEQFIDPTAADSQYVVTELPALETSANLDETFPQIVGYQLTPDDDQQTVGLTLYTEAVQPLHKNYAVRVELVGPNGDNMRCQYLPADGAYPSAYWNPDEIIKTSAVIPNCASAFAPGTDVYLRWASDDGLSDRIHLGWINQPLLTAQPCPAYLGTIDDSLRVIRYTGLMQQPVGDLYLPSVNWLTTNTPLQAVFRVYVLRQENGAAEFTCRSQPRLDTLPFSAWELGERVFFDECPMEIPATAPPGTYQLWLGVQDVNGDWLSAKDASGTLSPDHLIQVATVELVSPEESATD